MPSFLHDQCAHHREHEHFSPRQLLRPRYDHCNGYQQRAAMSSYSKKKVLTKFHMHGDELVSSRGFHGPTRQVRSRSRDVKDKRTSSKPLSSLIVVVM